MSEPLLYEVLFAWKCSSTHHKLALDALRHLQHDHAETWRNLFLAHIEPYLDGSKAPDNKFKDFKNHVLHVSENLWGGAVGSTVAWYAKALESLKARRWAEAIYHTGVMSHYLTDPWQPFHTGQSEAEGVVHRAAEWSIACAYQELQEIIEQDQGGYPALTLPNGDDWLSKLVVFGAQTSHPHYQPCIDHYDFQKGVKDPPAGMDQEMKDRIAKLIGLTVIALSRVLDRLFTEAGVTPPKSQVSLLGVMAQMTIPIFSVTRKMKNSRNRAVVEAMYKEFQQTGKVLKTLPEDDRTVRKLYAEEVLQLPLEMLDEEQPGPIGQAHGTGAPARPRKSLPPAKPARPPVEKPSSASTKGPRFHLAPDMDVEKGPSIGPKTAAILGKAGIRKVSELLETPPESLAAKLAHKYFDAIVIQEWQQQARLMCDVPELRCGDAQLLTGCKITDASLLSQQKVDDLFPRIKAFAGSADGERILRGGKLPPKEEVAQWIANARQPRKSAA